MSNNNNHGLLEVRDLIHLLSKYDGKLPVVFHVSLSDGSVVSAEADTDLSRVFLAQGDETIIGSAALVIDVGLPLATQLEHSLKGATK